MKILLVNKYYYLKGGTERYVFELEQLLKIQGHQVKIFSMHDPKNKLTADAKFFIKPHNFPKANFKYLRDVFNLFYRQESINQLKKLLSEFQPDVVHLNNINFQLTTSIISYLKKQNIPLVMTLHDYQLISPNHLLWSPRHNCPKACMQKKFYHCFFHRCYDNSYLKSLLAVLESYFNYFRQVYQMIDNFISPSEFLKQQLVNFGFKENKIIILPNFIQAELAPVIVKENYYLSAGRLSEEKGIIDLLQFFISHPEYNLKIAGSGPLLEVVSKTAASYSNISYLGSLEKEALKQALVGSKALIMASKWPENCPYSALEALSLGIPVLAPNTGGMPEIIQDGVNGFLYQNQRELLTIVSKLADENLCQRLSVGALKSASQYNPQNYYQELIKVYQQAINHHEINL